MKGSMVKNRKPSSRIICVTALILAFGCVLSGCAPALIADSAPDYPQTEATRGGDEKIIAPETSGTAADGTESDAPASETAPGETETSETTPPEITETPETTDVPDSETTNAPAVDSETTGEPETTDSAGTESGTTTEPETVKTPEPEKHKHSWKAATCDKPKTCSVCGATEGRAKSHKWNEFDYDDPDSLPIRCKTCGVKKCDVEGHVWVFSGCECEFGSYGCYNCDAWDGVILGHDWDTGICKRCGDKDYDSEELINALSERTVYYINQYRSEQGTATATKLPGLTEVAMYRAHQLTTNFAHDPDDMQEALAHFQYGEYYDLTPYGYPESDNYWDFRGLEAIGYTGAGDGASIDEIAMLIATGYRNSPGHWSYVGGDRYTFIAVGIEFDSGHWYSCILVADTDEYE